MRGRVSALRGTFAPPIMSLLLLQCTRHPPVLTPSPCSPLCPIFGFFSSARPPFAIPTPPPPPMDAERDLLWAISLMISCGRGSPIYRRSKRERESWKKNRCGKTIENSIAVSRRVESPRFLHWKEKRKKEKRGHHDDDYRKMQVNV